MTHTPNIENQMIEIINGSPPAQKPSILALKVLLDRRKQLDKQLQKQIKQIHASYSKKKQPGLNRVSEIINGSAIKSEQLKNQNKYFSEVEIPEINKFTKGHKIQKYWLTAILNSKISTFAEFTDEQKQILEHLEKVTTSETPDKLSITFQFSENRFISNKSLTKQIYLKQGVVNHTSNVPINWKKTLTKENTQEPIFKFFDFFTPKKIDVQTQAQECQLQYELYSQIARELIPYSIEYYFGVVQNDFEGQSFGEQLDQQQDESQEN